MKRVFMSGNDALAATAILAGLGFYAGYPITPATEILVYMAKHLRKSGGSFVQADSEEDAIFMAKGAAAAGARAMTSSSGPGFSNMQEGLSYLACAQLPCVVVDVMRAGPGLGGIQPGQADYFPAVKGGGHGDYHSIVLAPASVQEIADLTMLAFNIADEYRNPVIMLYDGLLGQMMEGLELPKPVNKRDLPKKDWAVGVRKNRPPNLIIPFSLDPFEMEQLNLELRQKYLRIKEREVRYEVIPPAGCTDPRNTKLDLVLVGYGTVARILKDVQKKAGEEGLKVAIVRPITLWPFPEKILQEFAAHTDKFLVAEMSEGQMVQDVRLSVNGMADVQFYGRTGGIIPRKQEIIEAAKKILAGELA